MLVDGDKVVTRKTFRGTHGGDFLGIPATGKPVSVGVIDVVRYENGQIVEHWNQVDMFGLMQQMGVIPS
jgi:predicted ester cyclase